MEAIKFHTDLEQSKVLATILQFDSADMFIADLKMQQTHNYVFHILTTWGCKNFDELKERESKFVHFIPCWSLGALLNILHNKTKDIPSLSGGGYKDGKYTSDWCLDYEFENEDYQTTFADNPVDACYEMIIKL